MTSYSTPQEWYEAAYARPQTATAEELERRKCVAQIMHESSVKAGMKITEEMRADELLLMTGRMDREEFNAYFAFKKENGGWR